MDKQHAVINYDHNADEHMVKDLGSLNGVSESENLPRCAVLKEPAFVLPIGPRAQSAPLCVQGS